MEELLEGLNGVECYQDDIIVHGRTVEEHDSILLTVLQRIKESGLKLNKQKCLFSQSELEFLGHKIGRGGTSPHPNKVKAIVDLEQPNNVSELRSVLGMVNHLGQYLPHLSTVTKPLNDLLKQDSAWNWGYEQEDAFTKIKTLVTSAPTLAYFDPSKPTTVSADASSYGIGGVLMQMTDGKQHPVAFCSRTLTVTEQQYAQIERECLACVWTCEKFTQYLRGLESYRLITDHKPLVPLIGEKDLNMVPLRCQRLLMRMMWFNPKPEYVPGKQLVVADLLSRKPLRESIDAITLQQEEDVSLHVITHVNNWPASPGRLGQIRRATTEDEELQMAIQFTQHGWPKYAQDVPIGLRPLYEARNHLSIAEEVLVYDDRIVVPKSMREEILDRIHDGHPGIVKSRERAKMSVWWPGLSGEISTMVERCSHCQIGRSTQRSEPLVTTPLPKRTWSHIAADLCELNGKKYLVVIDYYSRYLEIAQLQTTTSRFVITQLKEMFARWGICDKITTDNGPQFSSDEFRKFAEDYGFEHVTSSPGFPQSNGEAERAVQIAKKILRQDDIFLGLMTYRATPVAATGKSPAQIMTQREMKTRLPCLDRNLYPKNPDRTGIRKRDARHKAKYQGDFDRRKGVRPLSTLRPGDRVRIQMDGEKAWQTTANIHQQCDTPRSYIVETDQGAHLRRNRRHLQAIPGRQAQTAVATPTVMSTPEADARTPMIIHPPLLHSGSTYVEDIPEGVSSEETSTDDTLLRRSSRVSKPVNRLISEI